MHAQTGQPGAATTTGVTDIATVHWLLACLLALVVAAGVILLVARSTLQASETTSSFVRSWLALILIGGLLLFAAVALIANDASMRSTLIGGVIATAGSAAAFYFASRSSDQARRDILAASFGTVAVPDLKAKSIAEAKVLMSGTALELQVIPPEATPEKIVKTQQPPPDATVTKGSSVSVRVD